MYELICATINDLDLLIDFKWKSILNNETNISKIETNKIKKYVKKNSTSSIKWL